MRNSDSGRIAIVEDERIISLDLRRSLEGLGYTVVGTAADGASAIELARRERPDLMLMDIHLHGTLDGIETARRIREELGIACIFLTAYAEDETQQRAQVAHPLGYITKPFELAELHAAIRSALARRACE